MQSATIRAQEVNPAKLAMLYRKQFELCKGTLEAVKSADIIVVFHLPLFTHWLKDVMQAGVRVLMIIDAPDDLEQLMSPPGLNQACQ